MPGFRSIKTYVAEDGERVSIVEFASRAQHAAWRDHPEHVAAQQAGRERYFAEYLVQVCEVERSSRFDGKDADKRP